MDMFVTTDLPTGQMRDDSPSYVYWLNFGTGGWKPHNEAGGPMRIHATAILCWVRGQFLRNRNTRKFESGGEEDGRPPV